MENPDTKVVLVFGVCVRARVCAYICWGLNLIALCVLSKCSTIEHKPQLNTKVLYLLHLVGEQHRFPFPLSSQADNSH